MIVIVDLNRDLIRLKSMTFDLNHANPALGAPVESALAKPVIIRPLLRVLFVL